MRRLFFHLPGPGDAVIVGRGLTGGVQLLGKNIDRRAVLGVHHGQQPGLGRLLHRFEDLCVIGIEDARVGHEQLEARHALVDQRVHRFERELVDAADDLMKAVVDAGVAARLWRAKSLARPRPARRTAAPRSR